MNHRKMQLLVSSFIDGEVSEKERIIVRDHIKTCAECREFVNEINEVRKRIKSIAGPDLLPGFSAHVRNLSIQEDLQSEQWLGIEHLARNTVFAIAVVIIGLFIVVDYKTEPSAGISEALIDGSGSDSLAAQVLLNSNELSKNDLLYAVMTK
jgi:predicted anti-sigma-YlaC factor YlaD